MSTWAYCKGKSGCGAALPYPDLKDALRGFQICYACGADQPPLDAHTSGESIQELLDRVEALELVIVDLIGKKPPWPVGRVEQPHDEDDGDPL